MTQPAIDLKLLHDVKDYLSSQNDEFASKGASVPGSFSLFSFPMEPKNPCDTVYKGIILGNAKVAQNKDTLQKMGVTHVVNASMGKKFNQVNTDQEYYKDAGITFHGINALDIMTFKMTPHLRPAADFIEGALSEDGLVFVHCQQGVSRSATIVLAFLMLKREMDLLSAVKHVREKREIFPNDGFLKQLCLLNMELYQPDKLQNMDNS